MSKVYLAKYLHENQNRFHSSWNHNCRQTFSSLFIQQGRISLDGDMCSIIIPSESYKPVMKDPFAVNVLLNNKIYASPNRSFAHWTMYSISVLSHSSCNCSPIKLTVSMPPRLLRKHWFRHFFIFLLASLAGNTNNIRSLDFFNPAAVISFYFRFMIWIVFSDLFNHPSRIHSFYSLPLCLILYLFHSLYFLEKNGGWKNAEIFEKVFWSCFPCISFLNGPLNTGVAIIACPLIFFLSDLEKPETDV